MELIGSLFEFESDVGTSGATTEESDINTSSLEQVDRWTVFSEGTANEWGKPCGFAKFKGLSALSSSKCSTYGVKALMRNVLELSLHP
jgi:hypothetical protein